MAVPYLAASAGLRQLHPAYSGLVMATGIVSLASDQAGWRLMARALFHFNQGAYLVLWGLTLTRIALYWREFRLDLEDHARGPGFLTIPAATCVMGLQYLRLADDIPVACALWLLGGALWLILTYTVFALLTVKEVKPPLEEGLNGGWLVFVVAVQAVAVLGASLAVRLETYGETVGFTALLAWLWGGMLYIWIIALIFYRYAFFRFAPNDLTPPYWINMGAMAISTLAGVRLSALASENTLIHQLIPFIKGITLLFWVTGTCWIPLLIILGVWRHVVKRVPLRYDPLLWSAVFPLGMYTVATRGVVGLYELPSLLVVPQVMSYVALAAWCATLLGWMERLAVRDRSIGPLAHRGKAGPGA